MNSFLSCNCLMKSKISINMYLIHDKFIFLSYKMSVPHSTILSCSRGVLAKTDVGYCSPKQSQNSSSYAENNVKVVVYPKKEDGRFLPPSENA